MSSSVTSITLTEVIDATAVQMLQNHEQVLILFHTKVDSGLPEEQFIQIIPLSYCAPTSTINRSSLTRPINRSLPLLSSLLASVYAAYFFFKNAKTKELNF